MDIKEKSAYIKGLCDGLKLGNDTDEAKVISAIVDLLGDIAEKLDEIDIDLETNNDYIEEIDEDLGALEDYVLGDDDECDCDDDDCDCDCDCCGGDNDFRMLMCPHCNEEIYFDDTIEPDELICPACGKPVAEKCDCDNCAE